MFNLKYPIIQAPTDGPATSALAIAVSNAGALGALPLTWVSPDLAYKRVMEVRSKTSGSFFAGYVLNFPTTSLDKAIEAGIQIVQFSWGLPDRELVKKLRDHAIKIGIQVVERESALRALDLGPDYLVCQGIEAGGHVQGNKPLMTALEEVLSVANDVPVAASGGIATGQQIRKYISAGAAAAVLGSRFVATVESVAHPEYKRELVAAGAAADTVVTVCLNKDWSNATHRLLRNNTSFQMWQAAGFPPGPPRGDRPGEHDIVGWEEDGSVLERYVSNVPVTGMKRCDVNALGTYAGEGVPYIKDIPPAKELVIRLWNEFQTI